MERVWTKLKFLSVILLTVFLLVSFPFVKGVATENPEVGRSPAGLVFGNAPPSPAQVEISNEVKVPLKEVALPKVFPEAEMRRKGVQEIALIASDLGYFPKTLFLSRDIPARIYVTGASKNTLCMMLDAFQVRKQIRSQMIEEVTFMPDQPGKYRFYCPVNGMEGTLMVKELKE